MAKNTLANNDEFNPNAIEPVDILSWDDQAIPIDANELLEKAGINAPRVKMVDLLDQQFTIRYYRRFSSDMNERGYAYFAVVQVDGYADLRTTVLGAENIVNFLDLCAIKAPGHPVSMRVVQKVGGKFGKYYAIE